MCLKLKHDVYQNLIKDQNICQMIYRDIDTGILININKNLNQLLKHNIMFSVSLQTLHGLCSHDVRTQINSRFLYTCPCLLSVHNTCVCVFGAGRGHVTYQTVQSSTQQVHGPHLHGRGHGRHGGGGRSQVQVKQVTQEITLGWNNSGRSIRDSTH